MTRQYHLETGVQRSNAAETKKRAIEERKRLATIDALQRTRQQAEAVVRDLKNVASLLDQSIEAELQSSPTRDPGHFAFPMTARALMARRDNLRATIAALCDEFAKHDRSEWAPA
jgi:arginyl-tRNA synthetase